MLWYEWWKKRGRSLTNQTDWVHANKRLYRILSHQPEIEIALDAIRDNENDDDDGSDDDNDDDIMTSRWSQG